MANLKAWSMQMSYPSHVESLAYGRALKLRRLLLVRLPTRFINGYKNEAKELKPLPRF